MKRKKRERFIKRKRLLLFAAVYICALLCGRFADESAAFAITAPAGPQPTKRLTAQQAVNLAWMNSGDYRKLTNQIVFKEIKYEEAQKTIALKRKNMSTFRWSPLLTFKFPKTPALADAFDWTYKPYQLQSELSSLRHQLDDLKYAVQEKTLNLYVQVYTAQQKYVFYEENLALLEIVRTQNEARLYSGEAAQNDVDSIIKEIETTKTALLTARSSYESLKERLSEMIGINVSTGYEFVNPYIEAEISRDMLLQITEYTLRYSQQYYEAKLSTQLALKALDTNYGFMKDHYKGKDIRIISSYINTVKQGGSIDADAFKTAYMEFLKKIDSYWDGGFRILFITIKKEWLKGDLDGIRYIEDDPYVLYTAALEYMSARDDQNAVKNEITQSVRISFDNLVTVRNTYLSLLAQTEKQKIDSEKAKVLNQIGEMSFGEYREAENLYKESQMDMLDALDMYTRTLNSYDRLTCGAVTRLLAGESLDLDAAAGGLSYTEDAAAGNALYHIALKAEDNMFELRVTIPDDYAVEVTDFELWVNNIRIGERTSAEKVLSHLTLAIESADKTVVRFYNDKKFIADCEIDPYEPTGILYIAKGDGGGPGGEETKRRVVANYSCTINKSTGLAEIAVTPKLTENIAYYTIAAADGTMLGSGQPLPVSEKQTYFLFITKSMENNELAVILYDENKEELYQGNFDTENMTITVAQ